MRIIKEQTNTWVNVETFEVEEMPDSWHKLDDCQKTRVLRDMIPYSTSVNDNSETLITVEGSDVPRETSRFVWIYGTLSAMLGGSIVYAVMEGVRMFA